MLSFTQALIVGKARLFSIHGRSSRSEFWWIFFACLMLYIPMCFVAGMINPSTDIDYLQRLTTVLFLPFQFVILFASIRRGHDINIPTWITAILNLPILQIALLITMSLKGNKGPNKYGEDPLSDGFYDSYLNGTNAKEPKFWEQDKSHPKKPDEYLLNVRQSEQNQATNTSNYNNVNDVNNNEKAWQDFVAQNYDDDDNFNNSNKKRP